MSSPATLIPGLDIHSDEVCENSFAFVNNDKARAHKKRIVATIAVAGVVLLLFLLRTFAGLGDGAVNPVEDGNAANSQAVKSLTAALKSSSEPEVGSRQESLSSTAGDVERNAESDFVAVRGRAILTDGTLAPRMRLFALSPDGDLDSWRSVVDRGEVEGFVLGETWTDDFGNFSFQLGISEDLVSAYTIRQLNFYQLGQSERVYDVRDSQEIEYVVPGGGLLVKVVEPSGDVASNATITATFRSIDEELHSSEKTRSGGADGAVKFYYRESAVVDLTANRSKDGAFAERKGIYIDPLVRNVDCVLVLGQVGARGELKLVVLDQFGSEVRNYAVRILSGTKSNDVRFVDSNEIGASGVIRDIPIGEVEIVLASRFSSPPSLYMERTAPSRVVEVTPTSAQEVILKVQLQSRLVLDLKGQEGGRGSLGVRYRVESNGSENWQTVPTLWTFLEDGGATQQSWMELNDRYFSDVQFGAGPITIEIFRKGDLEVLWRGDSRLSPGEIHPCVVSL